LQGGRGDIQKGKRTGPYNERAGEEKSVGKTALGEMRIRDKVIFNL